MSTAKGSTKTDDITQALQRPEDTRSEPALVGRTSSGQQGDTRIQEGQMDEPTHATQNSQKTTETTDSRPVNDGVGSNTLQPGIKTEEMEVIHMPAVKIAIVGNVDSGKSTLCGLLSKGIADDGRGKTRAMVFNYNHEKANGRTSSVAHEIMGWNDSGVQQFPDHFYESKNKYWVEVVKKSSHFVNLIDLCGHEKYLKTTMTGMVGLVPDYAMVIVGANLGLSRMTKEHLAIAIAMKLPFFIVVTKVDMVDDEVLKTTIKSLKAILTHPSCQKTPLVIGPNEDLNFITEDLSLPESVLCPIFKVSSVTLEGVEQLTRFMYLAKTRAPVNSLIGKSTDPVQIGIHETFKVNGVGLTIAGTLLSGTLKLGQVLLCGPDKEGKFKSVSVHSIHVNRTPISEAFAGDYLCCAIKSTNKKNSIDKTDLRKGMMLLHPSIEPKPAWEFEACIEVLQINARVSVGYQAFMHCGMIRQSVNVLSIQNGQEMINAKEVARVRFRFLYSPEFIKPDLHLLIREGRTKIKGVITQVFPIGAEDHIVVNADEDEMTEDK